MPTKLSKDEVHEMPAMLDLSESQLPQIKGWKIGNKYKIVIEAEMMNQGKGMDAESAHRASFKVLSAKSAGESKNQSPAPNPTRNDKVNRLSEKAKEV